MGYAFDVDAAALFSDRTQEFHRLGLAAADVALAREAITDMWPNEPGGWVYEWSTLAAGYARGGDHLPASLAYGCAKLPGLIDPGRVWAYARQIQEYQAAAPTFGVRFERRVLRLPTRGQTMEWPVHLYRSHSVDAAVVLVGGGLDSWKVELHPWCLALTLRSLTVLAFDLPGTGECPVDLGPSADELVTGLIAAARRLGNGRVGYLGMSFGGNFSAMAGLRSLVDAAVVLGGPVRDSFASAHLRRLPYGMTDILGNALGYHRPPPPGRLACDAGRLTRADLLGSPTNSPMLVVNGADDPVVPRSDLLLFAGRSDTAVHLIPDSGHCADTAMDTVLPMITGWILDRLTTTCRG